jgi:ABC-type spermidine/putrescine transport system permease subunit II
MLSLLWILLPCAYLCIWAICGTAERDQLGVPSLTWFADLLSDQDWLWSFLVSISYALSCAAAACVLIALFAYSIHFASRWFEAASGASILLVILSPVVSLALSYKYFAGVCSIPAHWAYGVGNTLMLLPIAYAGFEAAQSHVARERLQAGVILGASHGSNFLYVFLPQAWRPLVSSYILCFLVSLDESVFSIMLLDTGRVPVTKRLWDLVGVDSTPRPAAAAIILALAVLLLWGLAAVGARVIRHSRRSSRRKHALL